MNSKILITGGSGFIGRPLVDLLSVNNALRLLVRSDYDCSLAEIINISDLMEVSQWEKYLSDIDVVIHLAGLAHLDAPSKGCNDYNNVNAGLTIRLAEAAGKAGVKQFIFVSTIKVNGETTLPGVSFLYDDVPAPYDDYARSKHDAECGLKKLQEQGLIETTVIRPPLVYGQGVKGNFKKLIEFGQTGYWLPLANVKGRRDMVSVSNLVDLIAVCIKNPAAYGQIFLISDLEPYSLKQVISTIRRVKGGRTNLFPFPVNILKFLLSIVGKSSVAGRLFGSLEVDISHTADALGWAPKYTMEETLRNMPEFKE